MMRSILFFLLMGGIYGPAYSQLYHPANIRPDSLNYENIHIKKISEDSLHTAYIIWVKLEVKAHYHKYHSEIIQVVSGKGVMRLGDAFFNIRKGDVIMIPSGSIHSVSVKEGLFRKPLKVLSVQSPRFDGDRVWLSP